MVYVLFADQSIRSPVSVLGLLATVMGSHLQLFCNSKPETLNR